ncbi:hypothetical protein C9374_008941 [Naegleria lovaniensis]|uniref:ELMO domain-containing protein n=1 Tax=Naegleria lovaniensis TaxID=51637 RepID=A0AA88GK09_NAELO|nr:uncharacterized protein C9374_008941 [Naegleria lovaniensis]KAG2377856.1 hypothetical protein C9374_008941 [Naegleria lovaniensis]
MYYSTNSPQNSTPHHHTNSTTCPSITTNSEEISSPVKTIKSSSPQNNLIQNIASHVIQEDLELYDGTKSRSISNASSVASTTRLIEMHEKNVISSSARYIDFSTAFDYFVNQKKELDINNTVKFTMKEGEWTNVSENCCFCMTRRRRVLFESLNSDLLEELRTYLALMTVPFSNSNSIHTDMCQEVFYSIMGREISTKDNLATVDVGNSQPNTMITKEWELIGFLGPNLEEEFRGFGVLGALMLLYFCTHHKELAQKIYALSLHEKKHFPFAISVLHLLKIAIDLIKGRRFNKFINENHSVMRTMQIVHADICREFLKLWSSKSYTELDFHHIIESYNFEIVHKESYAKKLLLSDCTQHMFHRGHDSPISQERSPASPSSSSQQTTLKNRNVFK